MATDSTLVAEIQRDLYAGTAVADLLRKCLALAQQADARELITWAKWELTGYSADADVPDYRRIGAMIYVEGESTFGPVGRQRFDPNVLPEDVRDRVSRPVIMHSVSQLQALVDQADPRGELHLQLPAWDTLAKILQTGSPDIRITNIYWVIPTPAIVAILDGAKTQLAELIGGLASASGGSSLDPTPEQTAQVSQTILAHRGARVSVTTAAGSSTATSGQTEEDDDPSWWTLGRKVGAFIVGCAVIAGTIIAWLAYVRP